MAKKDPSACSNCNGTCEVIITCGCGCGKKEKVKCDVCEGTGKNAAHRQFEERVRNGKYPVMPKGYKHPYPKWDCPTGESVRILCKELRTVRS